MDQIELTLPIALSTILIFCSPFIIQIIKKYIKNRKGRFVFAILLSAGFGVFATIANKNTAIMEYIKYIASAIGYSLGAYKTWQILIKEDQEKK